MRPIQHPKATVGLDGAGFIAWLSSIRDAWRRERPVTVHEAAQTLGKAAAAKRERYNRTLEEIKRDKTAQLLAESKTGWPVPPSLINKELAR